MPAHRLRDSCPPLQAALDSIAANFLAKGFNVVKPSFYRQQERQGARFQKVTLASWCACNGNVTVM